MLTFRSMRVLSLSLFALTGALGGLGGAPAWAADKLKCNKCVDTKDLANRAVTRKKMKQGAVDASRLRDAAVTPEKWALRVFDANNIVVGPVDPDGRVLMQATSGAHAGAWFTVLSRRGGLGGNVLLYTAADCKGQVYMFPTEGRAVPIRAGVGPDPATGAVAGDPVRLVAFLPSNPDAPPEPLIAIESQTGLDGAGRVTCFDTPGGMFGGLFLADPIDSPDLDSLTPPFRVGEVRRGSLRLVTGG